MGRCGQGVRVRRRQHVLFTKEELEQIPPESLKVVDVVQFVDGTEIDPVYFDKSTSWPRTRQRSKRMCFSPAPSRRPEGWASARSRSGTRNGSARCA